RWARLVILSGSVILMRKGSMMVRMVLLRAAPVPRRDYPLSAAAQTLRAAVSAGDRVGRWNAWRLCDVKSFDID
ncbi:MAG TPA: hypothetical protein VLT32_16700, partial [Candidatus Sulfomarinibacteraceae bacterium]|nr:hypothetical protein [Candidatus Sulfomarinibacteraceae bacterium]